MRIAIKRPGTLLSIETVSSELKTYQNIVGGYIEAVSFNNNGLLMVCNEEGLLEDLPFNFEWNRQTIVGTVFFCNSGFEEFADITDDQIKFLIQTFGKS